jgi:hypothetical protein
MITIEQMTAAHTFLAACLPANALRLGRTTQTRSIWRAQLQAAQQDRRAARVALQDLCSTRAVYQEALAAAQASRKLA